MKKIKQIIRNVKINNNLIPYKVVKLSTGVICNHYKNGTIKVV